MDNIQVGDKVRSFDFAVTSKDGDRYGRDIEGERASYVEGEVVGYRELEGCQRYVIHCTKRVAGGDVVEPRESHYYPPVNGTSSYSGKTDFVEKV